MDESTLSFSMASVVEDVLNRSQNLDLDSRRAQEAGVVGAKDLPAEPSEEEFRLGLRSGLILCNVLNKVHPGAVSKVVASSCDSAAAPDGAALSAYQYFEMKLSLPSQEDNLIAMCRSDIPKVASVVYPKLPDA